MSQDYNIRVVCRLRPLNKIEIGHGGECCVKFSENSIQIAVGGDENKYEFGFDRVFAPDTRQVTIYQEVAKPILNAVVTGFNGTVFAYGQTGGGKTWTMEGPNHDDVQLKGLIPRMMEGLFEKIESFEESQQFTIKCSYIEIYNEKIIDLLDPSKNKLEVKEDKTRGIFIQDCTEVYVASVAEMRNTMKNGSLNRRVAFTGMNERSSRSHSLFIVQVGQKDTKKGSSKNAKLYFVDLAGSEKVSKTGVSGQQLEEAKNINKSLSCLGNVINALTSEKKEHVPYRDSKLTRILQQSLGGNSRTTLIINCSMCSYNDKETLSTLRFGYRAKSIKNKAIINEEKSAKQLQILLDQAKKTILQLTDQLKGSGKAACLGSELTSQERQKYEQKIQQLQEELQSRQSVQNTSVLCDLELRIKQLMIENNSLVQRYKTDVEKLQDQNKKHVENIEGLFTKEAKLQKLLTRLQTDLNYLKLNLKYNEKIEDVDGQTKSIQSIELILQDIGDFADFLAETNERLSKQEPKDNSGESIKHKYEVSLSAPNLHDPSTHEQKIIKNFEQISCIIKQKIEDSVSEDANKQQENSTEIETLINQFNRENEEKNKIAIAELTKENNSLQKLVEEMRSKYDTLMKEFKCEELKLQQTYEEIIRESEARIESLSRTIKIQETDYKKMQLSTATLQRELSDEKNLGQKLLKIIQGNHDMNERYRLEQKAKEYAVERQKLFNQVYNLRQKLDEAEITLRQKDELIDSLKGIMKVSYEPIRPQQLIHRPTQPQVIKKEYNELILGVESKNIVKTIKGGKQPTSVVEQIKKSSLRSKLSVPQPKKSGLISSFINYFS